MTARGVRYASFITAILLCAALPASARGRSESITGNAPVSVTVDIDRVVDGDTIWIRGPAGRTDVRILGIDCPESKRNQTCRKEGATACEAEIPRGKVATARARELLHPGEAIKLEPGARGFQSDVYGRTLTYIRLPARWPHPTPRSSPWKRSGAALKNLHSADWRNVVNLARGSQSDSVLEYVS